MTYLIIFDNIFFSPPPTDIPSRILLECTTGKPQGRDLRNTRSQTPPPPKRPLHRPLLRWTGPSRRRRQRWTSKAHRKTTRIPPRKRVCPFTNFKQFSHSCTMFSVYISLQIFWYFPISFRYDLVDFSHCSFPLGFLEP